MVHCNTCSRFLAVLGCLAFLPFLGLSLYVTYGYTVDWKVAGEKNFGIKCEAPNDMIFYYDPEGTDKDCATVLDQLLVTYLRPTMAYSPFPSLQDLCQGSTGRRLGDTQNSKVVTSNFEAKQTADQNRRLISLRPVGQLSFYNRPSSDGGRECVPGQYRILATVHLWALERGPFNELFLLVRRGGTLLLVAIGGVICLVWLALAVCGCLLSPSPETERRNPSLVPPHSSSKVQMTRVSTRPQQPFLYPVPMASPPLAAARRA